jgi:hypothetical protein
MAVDFDVEGGILAEGIILIAVAVGAGTVVKPPAVTESFKVLAEAAAGCCGAAVSPTKEFQTSKLPPACVVVVVVVVEGKSVLVAGGGAGSEVVLVLAATGGRAFRLGGAKGGRLLVAD